VRLTDANGSATDVRLTLVVRPHLAVVTKRLPAAVAGHPYRATIAASGGVAPLQWSGSLPRGLKLNARTGAISGAVPSSGTFPVSIRVRDALGAVSAKKLALTVH
jgi:hypothetical protein